MTTLATRLTRLRKQSGLSMTDVAERSILRSRNGTGFITQSYISRLESGKEDNPSMAKILTLCKIYGTDPNYLCTGRPRKPDMTDTEKAQRGIKGE